MSVIDTICAIGAALILLGMVAIMWRLNVLIARRDIRR